MLMCVQTWLRTLALAPGLLLGSLTSAYLPTSFEGCNLMAWGAMAVLGAFVLALWGVPDELRIHVSRFFWLFVVPTWVKTYFQLRHDHRRPSGDTKFVALHLTAVMDLLKDWPLDEELTVESPWGDKMSVLRIMRKLYTQLKARYPGYPDL